MTSLTWLVKNLPLSHSLVPGTSFTLMLCAMHQSTMVVFRYLVMPPGWTQMTISLTFFSLTKRLDSSPGGYTITPSTFLR